MKAGELDLAKRAEPGTSQSGSGSQREAEKPSRQDEWGPVLASRLMPMWPWASRSSSEELNFLILL